LHGIGAAAHFLCGAVGMLVAGALLLRQKKIGYGWISVGMGAAVLLATVLLGMQGTALWERLGWDAGTVERVAAYGIPLWFMGMGARLLRGWAVSFRQAGQCRLLCCVQWARYHDNSISACLRS